jgi:3-hydroxyisobutyrate dehydrogenase-like beta-hydroxyacid dehydrogenase
MLRGKKLIQVGSALKLLGNSLILGVVEMLAETYALTDAIGFDPEVYQNFIRELFASSWQR